MKPLTQASPHAPVDGLTLADVGDVQRGPVDRGALGEPEADRHRGEQPGDRGDLAAAAVLASRAAATAASTGSTPTSSTSISAARRPQRPLRRVASESRRPSTTTTSAPTKLPIEKQACSRLITGRRRACSTLTPSAFMRHVHRAVAETEDRRSEHEHGVARARAPITTPATDHHAAADHARQPGTEAVRERAAQVHRQHGEEAGGDEDADDLAGAEVEQRAQPGQRAAEGADDQPVAEEEDGDGEEVAGGAAGDRRLGDVVRRLLHRVVVHGAPTWCACGPLAVEGAEVADLVARGIGAVVTVRADPLGLRPGGEEPQQPGAQPHRAAEEPRSRRPGTG